MSFSVGDDNEVSATINVTPLVDVMLVLLVIFMVTAPMMQQGVEVNLPKATTAPLAGGGEQVVISVDSAGVVYIGSGNKVEINRLQDRLAAVMQRRAPEDQKVYIKADRAVPYGVLMTVMSKIHAAGVTQIGLVSEADSENNSAKRK